MKTKIIILSAPSGSGKTTIANKILEDKSLRCSFSVSATSREPRDNEKNGIQYYFLSPEKFKEHINNEMFIEWEEVYPNQFYGTLKSEVKRLSDEGKNILFDVDVKGGLSLKKIFGKDSLLLFIMPPTIEELEKRLRYRNTEDETKIKTRVKRAEEEIKYSKKFDKIIINDNLDTAIQETRNQISEFINK